MQMVHCVDKDSYVKLIEKYMIGPVTAEEAKSDTVPNARLSVSIKLCLRQFVIIFNIYNKTEDLKIFLLPHTSAVRLNRQN